MIDHHLSRGNHADTIRDEALAEARDLAARLHADGVRPWQIAMRLLPTLCSAAIDTPTAQDLVRELPGLAEYDALADYGRRMRAASKQYGTALADIDGPPDEQPAIAPEQVAHRRRGERLARLIRDHAEELRSVLLPIVSDDGRPAPAEKVAASEPPEIAATQITHAVLDTLRSQSPLARSLREILSDTEDQPCA